MPKKPKAQPPQGLSERERYETEVRDRLTGTYEAVDAKIAELRARDVAHHEAFDRTVVNAVREREEDRIADLYQARRELFVRRIDYTHVENDLDRTAIYVGAIALSLPDFVVTSWAAPIVGQLMYAPYRSDEFAGKTDRIGELTLRHADLQSVVLTYSAFADEDEPQMTADLGADAYLIDILKETGRKALAPIIRTIQAEQHAIIAAPSAKIRIIQGVPGAGKTIIALHRIAYVLFNTYTTSAGQPIKAESVMFIGPNARFLEHIKEVLPALGQRRITATTPDNLLARIEEQWANPQYGLAAHLDGVLAMSDVVQRNRAMQRVRILGSTKMGEYIESRVRAILSDEVVPLIDKNIRLNLEKQADVWVSAILPMPVEPREPVAPRREEAAKKTGDRADEQQKLDEKYNRAQVAYVKALQEYAAQNEQYAAELAALGEKQTKLRRAIGSCDFALRQQLSLPIERLERALDEALRRSNGRFLLLRNNFERALCDELYALVTAQPLVKELIAVATAESATVQNRLRSDLALQVTTVCDSALASQTRDALAILSHKNDVGDILNNLTNQPKVPAKNAYATMTKRIFARLFVNDAISKKHFTHNEIDILLAHSKAVETHADVVVTCWISLLIQGESFPAVMAQYTHVIIDEAQDLSPLYVQLLTRLLPYADFTLYGDMAQNIFQFSDSTAWKDYFSMFRASSANIQRLTHTYRSTAAIMRYAYAMLARFPQSDFVEPIAIIPDGDAPQEIAARDFGEILAHIQRHHLAVPTAVIGVVAKTRGTLRLAQDEITRVYSEETPALLDAVRFVTVGDAKGLEFDTVFVVDADQTTYPDDAYHARLLFVALTRAARGLYVCYVGQLTALIPPPPPPPVAIDAADDEA